MRRRVSVSPEVTEMVIQIIDSGFAPERAKRPYTLFVFDSAGRPCPRAIWEMTPADIVEFVRHRWGNDYAEWVAEAPALTVH